MRDADVRKAVRALLDQRHADDSDTRIVEEMGVWSGSVRIDLAVINGELSGFELKSDRDTLNRLPVQADIFSRVFDKVALVVGERHVEKALEIIPDWWGVMLALQKDNTVQIYNRRRLRRNPSPDPGLIAQLLWRDEAIAILEKFDLAAGWRGKRVKLIHHRLADELPLKDLKQHVRTALKNRMSWLGQSMTNQLDVSIDSNLNPRL